MEKLKEFLLLVDRLFFVYKGNPLIACYIKGLDVIFFKVIGDAGRGYLLV